MLVLALLLLYTTCECYSTEQVSPFTMERSMLQENKDREEETLHYPVSSGRYTVREEIQKAPDENHFCSLTRTSFKISFPAMKSKTFVNFLGYKEPNMIHLPRCKGNCGDQNTALSCVPTSIREKKVKMAVKSFLAGSEPEEKYQEVVLEEHLECGCECSKEVAGECAGSLNPHTCKCECDMTEYGHARLLCNMRRDMYWDYEACQCNTKSVVPRGVEDQLGCDYFPVSVRRGSRTVDIAGWVLLGSCLALVAILAAATLHYRWGIRQIQSLWTL